MWLPSNSIEPSQVGRSFSRLLHLTLLLCLQIDAAYRHLSDMTATFGQYCENEVFNASCKAGEVILMTHAQYGRKALIRCVKKDYGHIGCFDDVIERADLMCSGRRQCHIRVPLQFITETTCPGDLKPYLETDYTCLKVETAPVGFCHSHQPVPLLAANGFLANVVTEATGCGGNKTPWLIEAKPGQTIRLTLYDFNVANRKGADGDFNYHRCILYANITEKVSSGVKKIPVCGGLRREKVVYTSDTNSVQVSILSGGSDGVQPHFVFKYEVTGCPDPDPIPNAWSVRSGDGVMVKCNFTKTAFHLKCTDNSWEGTLGNCSKAAEATPIGKGAQDSISIPYGLSILIVLAIALLIGLFVLFIGLMFLRRQRGLCSGGQDEVGSDTVVPSESLEKDYIRHTWRPQSEAGDSSGFGSKSSTWREPGGPYATYSTDLPPCTPLMDRQNKPPLYGQLQQKLPCGCPTYITGADPTYDTYDFEAENMENRERVVVNPGEPTRYFVLDPKAAALHAQTSQQNPEPPEDSSQTIIVTQPCKTPTQQTDDIKLSLRGEGPAIISQTKLLPTRKPNVVQSCEPKPILSTFKKNETYTVICKDSGDAQPGLSYITIDHSK